MPSWAMWSLTAATYAAAVAVLVLSAPVRAKPLEWARVAPASGSTVPPARREHAVGFDAARNRLLLFGGRVESKATIYGDTWAYDIDTATWTEVTGSGPAPRFSVVSGAGTAADDAWYVTAGEGVDRVFYNDVWRLALDTLTWTQVETTGTPPDVRYGTAGGTLPFDGSKLWVSHGFAKDRFDDSFELDLVTREWSARTPADLDSTPPEPNGPSKRCLHGGAVVADDTAGFSAGMVLFGGCGSGGYGPCPSQDAWQLRPTSASANAAMRWTKSPSVCNGPRLYSSMALLPGSTDTVVVFGGTGGVFGSGDAGDVSVWNVADDTWKRVAPAAAEGSTDGVPTLRQGAGMVLAHSSRAATNISDSLYVFGGQTSDGVTNELWMLTGQPTGMTTKDCPTAFDLRELHRWLMVLSWGIILPTGVTIARFGRASKRFPAPMWFKAHRALQYTGVILQTGGFIVAMLMVGAGKFQAMPHSIFGILAFLFAFQQPINAFFRPEPPHVKSPSRRRWEACHKYSGRLAATLGLLNPLWGLAYLDGAGSPSQIIYSVWVAILVTFWITMTLNGRPGPENPSVIARKARLFGTDLYAGDVAATNPVARAEADVEIPSAGPADTKTS